MAEPKRTRLIFLGFTEEMVARNVLELVKQAKHAKEFTVDDWVMVHKAPGGKLTITNDKGKDPGAARGAVVGGAAGMFLAAALGPVGLGAVVGAAAIGAVTAAVKDSGIKNDEVQTVSSFMADGRTGLMIAIPLEDADKWDDFVSRTPEFHAAIKRHTVDIVPGRTFEQAVEEYRALEEA